MPDPSFSRRALLRAGVVAGASSLAVLEAGTAEAATRVLKLRDFRALVGQTFRVRDEHGRVRSLKLTQVKVTKIVSATPGKGEAYSLFFRGTSGVTRMRSATYRLRHPEMGAADLFLQPIGTGRMYEAVVNRWRPAR